MATTYDHISQNKRRTVLLVLLFPITFALFTWVAFSLLFTFVSPQEDVRPGSSAQGYYDTMRGDDYRVTSRAPGTDMISTLNGLMLIILPVCWGLAMIWVLASYYVGDRLMLSGTGAIPISKQDQPEIYNLVENLCISRGLPVPKIYIINDDSLNAFATGRDPQHASIALTKGIVQKLERAELEGVIAHELAHVENRDIRLMLITVAGISFFTFLGEICFRLGLSSGRSRDKNNAGLIFLVLGLTCMIYGYVVAPLIRLAVSRTREYQADATAALTTRNPAALASALRKISSDSVVESLESHPSMAAMCIALPLKKSSLFASLSGLWDTHPPIQARIDALTEMDRGA